MTLESKQGQREMRGNWERRLKYNEKMVRRLWFGGLVTKVGEQKKMYTWNTRASHMPGVKYKKAYSLVFLIWHGFLSLFLFTCLFHSFLCLWRVFSSMVYLLLYGTQHYMESQLKSPNESVGEGVCLAWLGLSPLPIGW